MTAAVLIACGVRTDVAAAFADPIAATMERFAITSFERRAGFLAQCLHESASLSRLEEGLYYRSSALIAATFRRLSALPSQELSSLVANPRGLARAAYGSMNGNRGPGTDDGWAYRGSGIIQITGLRNFDRAQNDTGNPYVANPDMVRKEPAHAALTAGLYWSWNDCNAVMDAGDFDGLSKLINLGNRRTKGVPNGNQARRDLYSRVLEVLHDLGPAAA